nr:uncharacterized protein LOC127339812 [Lolium perenne]
MWTLYVFPNAEVGEETRRSGDGKRAVAELEAADGEADGEHEPEEKGRAVGWPSSRSSGAACEGRGARARAEFASGCLDHQPDPQPRTGCQRPSLGHPRVSNTSTGCVLRSPHTEDFCPSTEIEIQREVPPEFLHKIKMDIATAEVPPQLDIADTEKEFGDGRATLAKLRGGLLLPVRYGAEVIDLLLIHAAGSFVVWPWIGLRVWSCAEGVRLYAPLIYVVEWSARVSQHEVLLNRITDAGVSEYDGR